MAPSLLRPRKWEENFNVGDLVVDAESRRRLPIHITPSKASSAPANMPGKNPAATAAPGKRLHCAVIGAVELIPVPLFGIAVAEAVDFVEDADEVALDVLEGPEPELLKEGLRELVARSMLQDELSALHV